jgi:PPOX class probable F420-dependent enzyme
MSDDAALLDLFAVRGRKGVLTTLKRDGRPQLSVVAHGFDPDSRVLRISVTDTRAKTRNLRRDPRASYLVSGETVWQYAVAEADAELSEVTTDPHDATADELVDLYRELAGEHPDWDEFRAAMVAEGRLVLRLHVTRVYGSAG